jgi:hypothetical protein
MIEEVQDFNIDDRFVSVLRRLSGSWLSMNAKINARLEIQGRNKASSKPKLMKNLVFWEIFRVISQNAAKNLKSETHKITGNVRRMVD